MKKAKSIFTCLPLWGQAAMAGLHLRELVSMVHWGL